VARVIGAGGGGGDRESSSCHMACAVDSLRGDGGGSVSGAGVSAGDVTDDANEGASSNDGDGVDETGTPQTLHWEHAHDGELRRQRLAGPAITSSAGLHQSSQCGLSHDVARGSTSGFLRGCSGRGGGGGGGASEDQSGGDWSTSPGLSAGGNKPRARGDGEGGGDADGSPSSVSQETGGGGDCSSSSDAAGEITELGGGGGDGIGHHGGGGGRGPMRLWVCRYGRSGGGGGTGGGGGGAHVSGAAPVTDAVGSELSHAAHS